MLQFHIGPHVYRLVISDRSIYDAEGNEMEGAAIESRRLLIVSRIVERDRRYEVALHEFFHAWNFHVPPATDEEHQADLAALVSQQFHADLEEEGGVAALMALEPQAVPRIGSPRPERRPNDSEPFTPPDRLECHTCGASVMCGDIRTGELAADRATGRLRVPRWFKCDGCGRLQTWWEYATEDGSPTGDLVQHPRPCVLSGADADQWVAEHREVVESV